MRQGQSRTMLVAMMMLPDSVASEELMVLLESEAQGADSFYSMSAPLQTRRCDARCVQTGGRW